MARRSIFVPLAATGDVSAAQLASALAPKAEKDYVDTHLATLVPKTDLPVLQDKYTKAEVDLIETDLKALLANKPDGVVVKSITPLDATWPKTVTLSDGSQSAINLPAVAATAIVHDTVNGVRNGTTRALEYETTDPANVGLWTKPSTGPRERI